MSGAWACRIAPWYGVICPRVLDGRKKKKGRTKVSSRTQSPSIMLAAVGKFMLFAVSVSWSIVHYCPSPSFQGANTLRGDNLLALLYALSAVSLVGEGIRRLSARLPDQGSLCATFFHLPRCDLHGVSLFGRVHRRRGVNLTASPCDLTVPFCG